MDVAGLFLAGFTMVSLRSFQQLNVVHHRRLWVIPTSLLMAASEAFVIVRMSEGWNWERVLAYGLSAGLGCLTSMELHRLIRGRDAKV